MKKVLCIIGLERELSTFLLEKFDGDVLLHDMLPKFILSPKGHLFIEKESGVGYKKVDIVVYHGIFENDFEFLTALSFWEGPCFPNAMGMMNCRLKLPCLSNALKVTNYGERRGMLQRDTMVNAESKLVSKWGNWHCGDNKHLFEGKWRSAESCILEPFFEGSAVRIVVINEDYLQIRMEGEQWLKSIHHKDAEITAVDLDLLEDTRRLKTHFGLGMIANDYIIGERGCKYLLEVNHIPNMTRFVKLREIYIANVTAWLVDIQSN